MVTPLFCISGEKTEKTASARVSRHPNHEASGGPDALSYRESHDSDSCPYGDCFTSRHCDIKPRLWQRVRLLQGGILTRRARMGWKGQRDGTEAAAGRTKTGH